MQCKSRWTSTATVYALTEIGPEAKAAGKQLTKTLADKKTWMRLQAAEAVGEAERLGAPQGRHANNVIVGYVRMQPTH